VLVAEGMVNWIHQERLNYGRSVYDRQIDKMAAEKLSQGSILQLADLQSEHARIMTDIDKINMQTAKMLSVVSLTLKQHDGQLRRYNRVTERHVNDGIKISFQNSGYNVYALLSLAILKPNGDDDYSFDGLFAAENDTEKMIILVEAKNHATVGKVNNLKENARSLSRHFNEIDEGVVEKKPGATSQYLQQCQYLKTFTKYTRICVIGAHELDINAKKKAVKFNMEICTSVGTNTFAMEPWKPDMDIKTVIQLPDVDESEEEEDVRFRG
jgi:hypothetical protein